MQQRTARGRNLGGIEKPQFRGFPAICGGILDLLGGNREGVQQKRAQSIPSPTLSIPSHVNINLSVSDALSAHDVVLEVNDRGPGIPEAEIKDIFRPFYRIVRAHSLETGGFGVGLAIAERAVKLHGGELGASNRAGGGLAVQRTFPRLHVPFNSSYQLSCRALCTEWHFGLHSQSLCKEAHDSR